MPASKDASPIVGLTLYISSSSMPCVRAAANLRRILRDYKPTQVKLQVENLSDPAVAANHDVPFTPTLCKYHPAPPVWIVGDLSHPEALVELLEYHGVELIHGHRKAHHRNPRV